MLNFVSMNRSMSPYAFGTLLMIIGVLVLSPDSGVLRLIDGDPYVISLWRGFGICLVVWVFALIRSPSEFVRQLTTPSWLSLAIVSAFGFSSMAFVVGVAYLGAPTMLVFVSTTPLASAIASWLIFQERTDTPLLIAIIMGITGALIAGSGIPMDTPWEGFLAAGAVPILTGVGISLIRYFPGDTIWPLYGLSSLLVALGLCFALSSYQIPVGSEWYVILNACVIVPISFALITLAPKYLPAPEVGLYLLLETLIGPLIVWWLVGEAPREQDFLGGAILLTALIGLFAYRMRHFRLRNKARLL
ncbi:DMT family transporter [Litorivicinus sp.]|nr:DMT family transporter [Litorivicinus sp.]